MGEVGKSILIVDHDPEMAELLQAMLESDGYAVKWFMAGDDTVEQVAKAQPDLLIVDLAPNGPDANFGLLDQLRTDERTGHIPVVVMTADDALAEEAGTNYNVRGSLVNPFDLNDLYAQVREAIDLPRLEPREEPAPEVPLLAQAERILAAHSREAIFAWARRLKDTEPWRSRHDLGVRQVTDSVPILVEALTLGITSGAPERLLQEYPEVLKRARQHALLRRAQGISMADLVREYTVLRNEIWGLYRRYLTQQAPVADVLQLEEIVNLTLDHIVEATVSAYQEADGGRAA